MPIDDILMDAEINMEKSIEHLQQELRGVRTGRASPGLVEHIKVEYYGALTDIKSIAAISIPEATQILIKPFQPADLKPIEKALGESKMGLTAMSDGKMLRINLPAMSQDRRKQLAGQCKKYGEETKIQIRNHRRDANRIIETEQKGGVITEDERDSGKEQIDELTKKIEAKIDELVNKKNDEVMGV